MDTPDKPLNDVHRSLVSIKMTLATVMRIELEHRFVLMIFIILFLNITTSAQSISGQIIDYQTQEPVPFANIYFNNSYNGTASDAEGYFKLDISSNPGQEIIISSTGYEPSLLSEYFPDKFYKIYLNEKVTVLSEVEVSAKDGMSREKKMRIFKTEFLGTTRNGKSCVIENEDDLRLVYFRSEKSLHVFSDVPLIISNKRLGYQIRYDLEKFHYLERKRISYRGYAQFQEDTIPKKQLRSIERRRRQAFKGSRMEFFRLLWNEDLNRSRVKIRDVIHNKRIDLSDYVKSESKDIKSLTYRNTVRISHNGSKTNLSFKRNSTTVFTANGFFEPEGILWEGSMSEKRIGDLVPYEYTTNN